MGIAIIRKALEKHLEQLSGLPEVAWENINYSPTVGTPFLRPRLVPVESRPAAVGDASPLLHRGLFLVDIFIPKNAGPQDGDDLADTILSHFEAGTVLIESSERVCLRYAERAQSLEEPDWHQIPISITWYNYQ